MNGELTSAGATVSEQSLRSSRAKPFTKQLVQHWNFIIIVLLGIYAGLPFLAPVLMRMGLSGSAQAIYQVYSTQCHQLPERSYFLFGPKLMYSLEEIQAGWQDTTNPLILRRFIGSPDFGWKVAWSDRMVSMYTSLFIFAILWQPLRKMGKRLPIWGLILLILPLFLDGATHAISDFSGIGQGFRDSNLWLKYILGSNLSSSFYSGDGIGSFNSWMRIISGILFGLGVIWFSFPYLDRWLREAQAKS